MKQDRKVDLHFRVDENFKEKLDRIVERSSMTISSILRRGALREMTALEQQLGDSNEQ
jgi:antitoxin component of RelBE/YafQ-DinJ toxin-antitoxin module